MAGDSGLDPLMEAVVCCDEEMAITALELGANPGQRERETGYTPLHHACEHGLTDVVEALLERGADCSVKTRDLILQNTVVQAGGQTPLHLAAIAQEASLVERLLGHGADPRARDFDGRTPAVAAALRGHWAIARTLAAAANEGLPAEGEFAALKASAAAAGRERAAAHLSVPPSVRQAYTLPKVWSTDDCERLLEGLRAAARERPGGWTTARHRAYATTDIPSSAVPALDRWVRDSLEARVLPAMATRAGLGPRLVFRDLFFVRYSAEEPRGQRELAVHRDGSILSFNILLNKPEDFDGGGTFIEPDDRTYQIGQGDCFVHAGKVRHGGAAITRGERYLLVAFVDLAEDEDLLPGA